jgi:hypothetical protein
MINGMLRYLTTLYQLQITYSRMKLTNSDPAIAQAVSRQHPTAEAQVRARFFGAKNSLGQVLS